MIPLRIVIVFVAVVLLACPWHVRAQSAENVAVVINDLSPDSQRIGEHYVRVRGIPPSNVFRIRTAVSDAIGRDEYLRAIEGPLGKAIARAGLQDRVHFIVLTKGIPLRILGRTGVQGDEASVDSELTLLYRRLTGQAVTPAGVVENPYFLGGRELTEAKPFSHRDHDIYLVTRLDGFTTDDAIALVERARTVGDKAVDGKIVLDQRASPPASNAGDELIERAAHRLEASGHEGRVVLETTPNAARGITGVIGRFAWGAADPSQRMRTAGVTFAPGAIAANIASFDARTFQPPPESWQPTASADRSTWFAGSADGLIGDLIRDGVTGVSGQVGEALLRGAVRPEILLPAYLAGFTLAEAYYLALPTLSWQAVIVGDPLAAPFPGRRMARAELEEEEDPTTGGPALFGRRRLAVASATNPDQPNEVLAQLVRAEGHLAREDLSGARDALGKAAQLAPKSSGLLLVVAALAEKAGTYDDAIEWYRRVLELDPANLVALNNLAYALAVRRNQPTEALPFARKAASLAPRVGGVVDTLGWIEHLLGNHQVAADLLAYAVRLESTNAEIRLHAAIVYAVLGREQQSQAELEYALKLDPSLERLEDVQRLKN